ncbi:MAG TPA: transglycosylase domain-containing protein [Sporichthya sp.]|nr:transglycosylase domain-containing protein [Sporichthya sp.]
MTEEPEGPQSAEDKWFRPDPPPPLKSGKPKPRSTRAADDDTGPQKPVASDAPTESFTPPKNWLEDKGEAKGEATAAAGAAAGAGGTRAAAKAANGQGGGTGRGPGRGRAAAAGAGTGPPRKKKSKKKRRLQRALWAVLAMGVLGFFMMVIAYSRIDIPDPNKVATQQTSRVYFADNDVEIGRFGDINRTIVGLDKMPQSLRDAVLAAENRSFYSDSGVSPRGMFRAFWNNLRGGSTQGGSTITQQYVKNTYLSSERSVQRKLKEALLAIKIDREKSKDQILEDYLNTIYLGRGAYGVQAAAKAYWNTDVQNLTPSQGIALAAIIQRPSAYDPSDPDGKRRLEDRWNYVADGMVQTKALTPEARAALKFPKFPKQAQAQSRYGGQRGYILTAIKKELLNRGLKADDIENGGYRIVTTMDEDAQNSALDAVAKEFPKTLNKGLRTGLVAVEPGTGKVLAMYGGPDFLGKGRYAQVNTATYPIQAGSTMKIFTTAALLEAGYSLNSTFSGNSPLTLPGSKPVNNEFNQSYGTVTLRKALEQSINTAFVQATYKLGSQKVRNAMVRAGIPNDTPGLETNARITLGIASTPAIEVAGALATICGGGIQAEPHLVERVLMPNGGVVPIRKPVISPEPVFDPEVISGTLEAMQDVVKFGTGTKAKALNRPVAGKTGTHQDLTAWFSGCTPQLAASVLYFKGDGTKSLDGTAGMSTFFGGTYPAQTWTTFMKGALKGKPVEDFPKFTGSTKATPTATKDPYDVGGFNGQVDPGTGIPPGGPGPIFPTFTTPPSSVPSPTPKPSPTPSAPPTPSAEPQPTGSSTPTDSPNPGQGGKPGNGNTPN